MGIRESFETGVEAAFSVFTEAVKQAEYVVVTDDGFSDPVKQSIPVRVILDRFSQEDVEHSSFYDLIQPTDTKGMIPGKDFTIPCSVANQIVVDERKFSIVASETDPFNILYTLLLRDV